MSSSIIKADITSKLTIAEDSKVEKRRLLDLAGQVVQVTTPEEQSLAVRRGRELKLFLGQIESDRKTVKGPVIAVEKRIDELAKELRKELEIEVLRIEGLVNAFQDLEDRRVAAEERERQQRIAKAEEDRRAAESLVREAEDKLTNESASLDDAENACLAQELAAQTNERANEILRAPLPVANRVQGMVQRTELQFTITDAAALYAEKPGWFELVPKRRVIRDNITEHTVLPGIKIWMEKQTSLRT